MTNLSILQSINIDSYRYSKKYEKMITALQETEKKAWQNRALKKDRAPRRKSIEENANKFYNDIYQYIRLK